MIRLPELGFTPASPFPPLDSALSEPNGLRRFEPGAQGEHKIARGFLPVRTRSFHRLIDARFSAAVGDALRREGQALEAYREELLDHSPYRQTSRDDA